MIFDYPTLKFIWWLLIGVILIGFAVMDGHDMGVGTLLPFVGKTDEQRRVLLNTVGPHWDGNQVWFITGGAGIFAAWPLVYATAFSGFYWAMLAVLWALFFRPVGFDYRSKIDDPRWRKLWDWGLFAGGAVPPLIFGVAFGNLLQGVPFHLTDDLLPVYTGSFWALLNPFALLCGLIASLMITGHGAVYLALRTEGEVQRRATFAAQLCIGLTLAGFSLAGIWLALGDFGYAVVSAVDYAGPSNPLAKTAAHQAGAWFCNYQIFPATMLIPALAYVAGLLAAALVKKGRNGAAFVASGLMEAGIIGTAGASMFPFMLPSSSNPSNSLIVWDAASSPVTLTIMFWAALVMMPIIIAYTSWAYKVMSGKMTEAKIRENSHSLY
jgi:cytochrome d ubiquinol oxidase subunit II